MFDQTIKFAFTFLFSACGVFGSAEVLGQESKQISILVNKGPFKDVVTAAAGESKVNFGDSNPADENAVTECYAAVELKTFLVKATGVEDQIIVFPDHSELPPTGDVFIMGCGESQPHIEMGASDKTDRLDLKTEQSFRIRSFTDNGRTVTIIEGASRIGTLYGVYGYLNQLGVKFIGLGETGTVLPNTRIDLLGDLMIVKNPSYLTRGYWAWGDRKCEPEFFEWMARNQMNFWTAENQPAPLLKKLGIKLTDGGHKIQRMFINPKSPYAYRHQSFESKTDKPVDAYPVSYEYQGDQNKDGILSNWEAHPEWFGLHKGVRSKVYNDKVGDNFCTSNHQARQELAKNMVDSLIDGEWKDVDVVNFWMSDYGRWCTCDQCKDHGSETDRLFVVIDEILNQVKSAREDGRLTRRVEISAIAYAETLPPPTRPLPEGFDYENCSVTFFPIRRCFAHALADANCSELNKSQRDLYTGWVNGKDRHYQGSMFIGEYYNISKFQSLPVVFSKVIGADVPWYFEHGARHFHYMHVPTRLWGTWTLNQYLLGRMLWNKDAKHEQVLNEYFQAYYPTTEATTREMYQQLEIASANMKILKHDVGTPWHFNLAANFLKGDMFRLDHFKYDRAEPGSNAVANSGPSMVEVKQASQKARALVRQSLAECTNERERQRLLEDQRRVEYGFRMSMYLYHIVRTAMFHHEGDNANARKEFVELRKYAVLLAEITDLVQVASNDANSENGFKSTYSTKQYQQFQKLYGAQK